MFVTIGFTSKLNLAGLVYASPFVTISLNGSVVCNKFEQCFVLWQIEVPIYSFSENTFFKREAYAKKI